MLDYKKLRKEFKEVLSKIGEAEIESWLKFDEERMKAEPRNRDRQTIKLKLI